MFVLCLFRLYWVLCMQYVFWGSTHVQAKPFGATLSFDKLDNLSSLCFDISYLQNSSVYHKHFKLCEAYLVCKEQIYITLCKLYCILGWKIYGWSSKVTSHVFYVRGRFAVCRFTYIAMILWLRFYTANQCVNMCWLNTVTSSIIISTVGNHKYSHNT